MKHVVPPQRVSAQDYAALRQTGTQAARARVELELSQTVAEGMERLLQIRTARGAGDKQLPRFARHDAHVAAAMRAGGFWAFSEKRLGKHGFAACLPLIPPAISPTPSR